MISVKSYMLYELYKFKNHVYKLEMIIVISRPCLYVSTKRKA